MNGISSTTQNRTQPNNGPRRHHDGIVRLWDPGTSQPVGDPLTDRHFSVVNMLAFARVGKRDLLASACDDGTVPLIDLATAADPHLGATTARDHDDGDLLL